MYEIADTNAYPLSAEQRGRRVYPFGVMKIGQSIGVPKEKAAAAQSAAVKWKARHPGWSYATRVEDGGSLRIWRIA